MARDREESEMNEDRLFDTPGRTVPIVRLYGQNARVYNVLRDGEWHELWEIAERTGDSEASISARIRDLKKDQFGGHEIDKQALMLGPRKGQFRYRLVR